MKRVPSKSKGVPLVRCSQCQGLGMHPLPDHLWITFRMVKFLGEAHAGQVKARIGWTRGLPAIGNRLERLRKLGFLVRRRFRAHIVYSVSPQAVGRSIGEAFA